MTNPRTLDQHGVLLISGSFVVLMLVAGAVAWQDIHTPTLDPVTLRAAGKPVTGDVTVLLDVTDALTPKQLAGVQEWLRDLDLSSLRANERVTIWALGAQSEGGMERIFSRYFPGRESDRILHNPALSAARCESLFTRPLLGAVVHVANGPHVERSPILESIRDISNEPEFSTQQRRRLIVISDLRQNVANLSFYRSVPRFSAFRKSRYFSRIRASLQGVAVDILYLPRGSWDVGRSNLPGFWNDYLNACGAASVTFQRL
jgi:hypothetical protein